MIPIIVKKWNDTIVCGQKFNIPIFESHDLLTKISHEKLSNGGYNDGSLYFSHPPLPFFSLLFCRIVRTPAVVAEISGALIVGQRQNCKCWRQKRERPALDDGQPDAKCCLQDGDYAGNKEYGRDDVAPGWVILLHAQSWADDERY